MNEYEANCILAEKEFNTLDSVSQYRNKVEPLKYALLLICGILCLIISLVIIVHLFLFLLLKVNGKPVHPFLNNFLEVIQDSKVAFLATVLFVLIGYYLMFSTFKGNVKLGMRFFCITFYPMK